MIKESQRDYTLSDADLCMFTSNLVGFMTRDAAEFVPKGVDAAAITALEALGNAFEIFPNDAYYKNDVTISVDAKNEKRENSQVQMRAIIGCAKIKWGMTSPQVKRFNAGKMTVITDRSFLTLARQCVTLATEYLADLAAFGLTQPMIDALAAEAQLLEDEMNNISEKESLRDLKTQERINDGNELYGFVALYCEIGKIIWQDVDEAKYYDYVIYPAVQSSLSKPQNLAVSFDPLDPSPVTLTWDLVAEATSYDVYFNIAETGAPAGDYTFLNTFPTSPAMVPPIFGKRNYYKIKAKNDTDTSVYSDSVWADIPVV